MEKKIRALKPPLKNNYMQDVMYAEEKTSVPMNVTFFFSYPGNAKKCDIEVEK